MGLLIKLDILFSNRYTIIKVIVDDIIPPFLVFVKIKLIYSHIREYLSHSTKLILNLLKSVYP